MIETLKPRIRLTTVCTAIFLLFWILSSTRHWLLQSNAYDLGLFDQWIWLISKRLPPYSSMEGVHVLADHGALSLYIAAIPYRIFSSVHWLLASQAAALSFTAIPLWWLSEKAGLSRKLCWLACGLWWLQPVVFNVNLFDFHPEVWAMPALAISFWCSRNEKFWLWLLSLFFLLSCRDGLVLIILGIGIEQILRKRWQWGITAIGISFGWLIILNNLLYPFLTKNNSGPKAIGTLFSYLGNSLEEVVINLLTKPNLLIQNVNWLDGIFYLILISISLAPFWKKQSVFALSSGIPLIIVNFLSSEAPQRTLIHHYSLPIAVITVIGAIDGLAINPRQNIPYTKLFWSTLCWVTLAKPWFFAGHYLNRIQYIGVIREVTTEIPKEAKLITTSYLVPHFSHRVKVDFPREGNDLELINDTDILLLNPIDPGWGSTNNIQSDLIEAVKEKEWNCSHIKEELVLCKKPQA
ncbi:DUF2079 domain-containing protein [Prochlorococcus sp. MIT 1341]|uniref:DUF2079 domain-containing protein n=1 Tax=Prochlorococcus sp. MIT 1341 TaxID=3096221 RepID=UPI002A7606C5|nr:DUF2079 domain-containing protein [Prochlorococcus sp. MIT 1341]